MQTGLSGMYIDRQAPTSDETGLGFFLSSFSQSLWNMGGEECRKKGGCARGTEAQIMTKQGAIKDLLRPSSVLAWATRSREKPPRPGWVQ